MPNLLYDSIGNSFPQVRLRRRRSASWVRSISRETSLSPEDLILPLFVHAESKYQENTNGLPNMGRHSEESLIKTVEKAKALGIKAVAVFPVVDPKLKNDTGEEAFNPDNLICRTVKAIKSSVSEIGVITDVALDPYLAHGHDGLCDKNGIILNDETISTLCKQAIVLAAAGSDIIAPSDMMDGRVIAIRNALDNTNHSHVSILSYSVKYCSAFYGPFRSAVGSVIGAGTDGGTIDKSTYQMDYANIKEALAEVEQDTLECADFIMVKPGGHFLDVISKISMKSYIPVFAYHVSGEYAMIVSAADRGFLDYNKALNEIAISFKRAGTKCILTYAALDIASQL